MAIERTMLNGVIDEFIVWCNNNLIPTYFTKIEFDSNNNLLFYVSETEYILSFYFGSGAQTGSFGVQEARIYQPHTTTTETPTNVRFYSSSSSTSNNAYVRFGAICTNGAIIRATSTTNVYSNTVSTYGIGILITKNNHGETVVVCGGQFGTSSSYSNALSNNIYVSSLEADSLLATTFPAIVLDQVELIPFMVTQTSNQTSYTPNAFYMMAGNIYATAFTRFELNGSTYMTNGYWSIKD